MRKFTPKPYKKRQRRKRVHRESRPKDIQRSWTLATRLEYRRIKGKQRKKYLTRQENRPGNRQNLPPKKIV